MTMTATAPRQCYWIDVSNFDSEGWIPSLVTEGQPGHAPLAGNGPHASPWHWGRTYEAAKTTAERMNREDFGLEPADALAIVLSSMRAQGGL